MYDWEIIYDDTARTDNISVDVLTDCCVAFCETIKNAGYTPMIYQNKRTSIFKLDLNRLNDYDFWLDIILNLHITMILICGSIQVPDVFLVLRAM